MTHKKQTKKIVGGSSFLCFEFLCFRLLIIFCYHFKFPFFSLFYFVVISLYVSCALLTFPPCVSPRAALLIYFVNP